MSDAQDLVAPRMLDLEQDTSEAQPKPKPRHWIIEQTAGRIDNLEVEARADRIQIRGRAASCDLQDASVAILEATRLLREHAPRVEIDVRITVVTRTQHQRHAVCLCSGVDKAVGDA